jgi:hypothetical protein
MKTKKSKTARGAPTARLHSILSPSSSHRWLGDGGEGGCGASIRLIGLYQQEENAAMSEGTLAHSRLEKCLNGSIDAKYHSVEYTREISQATDAAADYCRTLRDREGTLTAEGRLDLPQIAFKGTLDGVAVEDPGQGHADCIVDNADAWHVVDFKYGYGTVEVEENPQLLLYALACFKRKRKKCVLHIIQPRGSHPDGPTRKWTASVAYMAEFERKVLAQVKLINAGTAPFMPSGPVCKYCPMKSKCQAFQEKALSLVNKEFSEFMDHAPAATATPIKPLRLTDKQLANAWLNWPMVEQFKSMLDEMMLARLTAGAKLPAKLVRGNTHAVWVDEDEAAQTLLANGVRKSAVYTTSLVTPAVARRLLRSKASAIDDLIAHPQGPVQIAPLSDKRTPIKLKGK